MLWEMSPSTFEKWEREGAFTDRESCVKEARKVTREMPNVKFEDRPGGIWWRSLNNVPAMRQCWPDTVDLRGPKGSE